jgi:hypothetical protein
MAISRIVAKFKASGSVHNKLRDRATPAMDELDTSAAESIIDAPTLFSSTNISQFGVTTFDKCVVENN